MIIKRLIMRILIF